MNSPTAVQCIQYSTQYSIYSITLWTVLQSCARLLHCETLQCLPIPSYTFVIHCSLPVKQWKFEACTVIWGLLIIYGNSSNVSLAWKVSFKFPVRICHIKHIALLAWFQFTVDVHTPFLWWLMYDDTKQLIEIEINLTFTVVSYAL